MKKKKQKNGDQLEQSTVISGYVNAWGDETQISFCAAVFVVDNEREKQQEEEDDDDEEEAAISIPHNTNTPTQETSTRTIEDHNEITRAATVRNVKNSRLWRWRDKTKHIRKRKPNSDHIISPLFFCPYFVMNDNHHTTTHKHTPISYNALSICSPRL